MRRTVWGGLLVFAASSAAPIGAADEKPNVVIIVTDDQGTLDARSFGSSDLETPAIDRLAEQGVRFTQAYAHTVCVPARAMLMTGRHPQRSDVNSWTQGRMWGPRGRNMLLSEVTLAEVLREAGYRTALFGKWHLGSHPDHGPVKQGFDEFFGMRDGFIDNYVHYQLHRTGFHDLFEGDREVYFRGQYFPDMIADRAVSFIHRNQDRPFFLYYALNIPHYPEQPLSRFEQRYSSLPEPRRSYAAMISTTDHYIDRVLRQLEALDLQRRTIVVFMSDNGHSEEDYQISVDGHPSGYIKGHDYGAKGGGGNTGRWIGAKGSFLEGGIRVPAILSYPPGLPQGVVREQAITAMDWFPTILELCGIDRPKGVKLDGHSVLPLVADPAAPSRYRAMFWQWQEGWMVREGDWKLIVGNTEGLGQAGVNGPYLANLADERPEATNHAAQHPDVVGRLTQLHSQWIQEVVPSDLPEAARARR
jgi:arylsulfatase A-like enzyme